MFKLKIDWHLNSTNTYGYIVGLIGAHLSNWQIVLIGAIIVLGRKGLDIVEKYIEKKA